MRGEIVRSDSPLPGGGTATILRLRVDEKSPSTASYLSYSEVRRSGDVVRVKLFRSFIESGRAGLVEVSVSISPNDQKVVLTDGIHERVVWTKAGGLVDLTETPSVTNHSEGDWWSQRIIQKDAP